MSDHAPEPRERLLWPILIPVAVLVVIGAVLFLFSRVLLRVTPTAATLTALVVAASILGVATVVASRPQVTGASLLSMVGGVAGIAMLTGGLALLLGQPAQEAQPFIVALTAPKGAATKGFETKTLSAPAAYPLTIAFTNDDAGVQHNVVVAEKKTVDPTGAIAAGQPATGVATVDVPVGPLAAGSYYFFCEFHPTTMTGTLTVAGPPPSAGAPAGPVITASDSTAFSPNSIDLPAGQPATITFEARHLLLPLRLPPDHDAGNDHRHEEQRRLVVRPERGVVRSERGVVRPERLGALSGDVSPGSRYR